LGIKDAAMVGMHLCQVTGVRAGSLLAEYRS